jgi:hypothetical protein
MQTANCLVHVGGDSGTTVPKYAITASEIAVLRAIHGPDSITEVEPTDDVQRSDRNEIARLHEIYSRPDVKDGPVHTLFPGVAARAYQTLDELEIPADFYKAESRVKPKPAEKPAKAGKARKADAEQAPDNVEATLAEEDKLFD